MNYVRQRFYLLFFRDFFAFFDDESVYFIVGGFCYFVSV